MNCQAEKTFSFGALICGAFKLAIALPLLWWGISHCEMLQDIHTFFSATLPSLFRLLFFGRF